MWNFLSVFLMMVEINIALDAQTFKSSEDVQYRPVLVKSTSDTMLGAAVDYDEYLTLTYDTIPSAISLRESCIS